MYAFIMFSYEFLCAFLPFCMMFLLSKKHKEKFDGSTLKYQDAISVLFALYCVGVFYVTGAGTLYDALSLQPEEWNGLVGRINFLPFSREISWSGYLLNIIMLMPFGFLLPLSSTKGSRFPGVILMGLLFSFLIEGSQLLCARGTDVDDLIMNTTGTVAGYLIYMVWNRITKKKCQCNCSEWLLPFYLLVMFLGRFFLFNRMGLIKMLYGF